AWTRTALAGAGQIHAIWASGPNDVYAVGISAFHYDGAAWSALAALPTSAFDFSRTDPSGYKSVWGSGPNDVYILYDSGVGVSAPLWHYDGTEWTSGGAIDSAQWMWGSGPDDIFIVGDDITANVIEHLDHAGNATIMQPPNGINPHLYGVWGTGP